MASNRAAGRRGKTTAKVVAKAEKHAGGEGSGGGYQEGGGDVLERGDVFSEGAGRM